MESEGNQFAIVRQLLAENLRSNPVADPFNLQERKPLAIVALTITIQDRKIAVVGYWAFHRQVVRLDALGRRNRALCRPPY